MASNTSDDANRTMFCGNLSPEVDEEILYELFSQAGPLEKVSLPKRDGFNRGFGFIVFKHECSVPYAIELFRDTQLFGREPILKFRNGSRSGDINSQQHQRSLSCPINFSGPPMDYDALLAMSKNILSGNAQDCSSPGGMVPMRIGTSNSNHYSYGTGPAPMQFQQYSGMGPSGGPHGNSHSHSNYPESSHDSSSTDLNKDTLSMNSLQGNWSAPRNNSNLLPHSEARGREHRSRRDERPRGGDYNGRFGHASQSWDRGRDRGRDRDWEGDRQYERPRDHHYSDKKRSYGRSGYGYNNRRNN